MPIEVFTHNCSSYFRPGESNSRYNTDKYACSFSKLIQYWRRIWHERTNGMTNIEFPFGFVQVCAIKNYLKNYFLHRYQPTRMIRRKLVVFHGFGGTKHLMLVMFQIMLFQKSLWLLL